MTKHLNPYLSFQRGPASTIHNNTELSMHLRKKSSENVLKIEDNEAWESHTSVGKS